jgi:hypothetical protein
MFLLDWAHRAQTISNALAYTIFIEVKIVVILSKGKGGSVWLRKTP